MTLTEIGVSLLAFFQRQLDRVVSPRTRQEALNHVVSYANERPLLFAFVLAQVSLSALPILLFASFVISTFLFAFGLALLFTLFWVGVALLLLVPTLLTTFSIGIGLWAWGVASVVVLRWLYTLVPNNIKGSLEGGGSNGDSRKTVLHNGTKPSDKSALTDPHAAPVSGDDVNGGINKGL